VDWNLTQRRRIALHGWTLGVLGLAFLTAASPGCSDAGVGEPTPSQAAASTPPGAQDGELVTYIATFPDGHSERQYALRLNDSRETRLVFADPSLGAASLASGAPIRVWGAFDGTVFNVRQIEDLSPPSSVQVDSITYPVGASETYAFVLVDLGGGVNLTSAQAQTAMFGTGSTDKSFAEYYGESAFGKYQVSGDVVGPYTYTMTGCDTTGLYKAIEPQITKTYNHYIYYFGQNASACAWGGLGEEGSVGKPAKRTWINGADSCVVLMQEPGHNLGLMHGNTLACPGASFSATPATSCTVTEYGDPYTTMGHGCHQLNGYERWYDGWLSGCNGVRVTSTGTFNLLPLEESGPCGGVQVLQVPMPATRTITDPQDTTTNVNLKDYYVELRAAGGIFDTTLKPTVVVYASDDVHTGNQTSVWTELLDMNPSTTTFDGLAVGQTFTDPSGSPSITLESVSASGATITVTVTGGSGSPMCIGGGTLTPPGPTTCAGGGSDAGVGGDGGGATDAGSVSDGGVGSGSDGGSGSRDAGADAGLDAGSGMDAGGSKVDAGSMHDAGADAGATNDGGTASDAGSSTDAGSFADASETDANAPNNAGGDATAAEDGSGEDAALATGSDAATGGGSDASFASAEDAQAAGDDGQAAGDQPSNGPANQHSGCACDVAGGGHGAPSYDALAGAALVFAGWSSRRRRARKRGRALAG
jgi:MYXO-CTERM domain-containing protein